jgi:hypothetical protein
MLRRVAALAIVSAVLLPSPVLAGAAGAGPFMPGLEARRPVQAVTWSVDHARRTITAVVRLQLGTSCTRGQMVRAVSQGPASAARCKVRQEIAEAIKRDVDAVWNQQLKYSCYTLRIETDIAVAVGLEGAVAQSEAAPADRIHVAIDQSAANVRSIVNADRNNGNWSSPAGSDSVVPANGGATPTVWKYPMTWETSLYAHEVGHVLGLSDQYEDFVGSDGKTYSRPQAGAPNDIMTSVVTRAVDPSTIRLLVERAGIKRLDLKCDYTADGDSAGVTVRGTKCDGIAGDWVGTTRAADSTGSLDLTFTITAAADGTGTYVGEYTERSDIGGAVSVSKGLKKGAATLSFLVDGTAVWQMQDTEHTRSGTMTAGGVTIKSPKENVPLANLSWQWPLGGACPGG